MNKYTSVPDVLTALPGGFEADWSLDFRADDGETIVTTGPDWADGIPGTPGWRNARSSARDYNKNVAAAIAMAIEYETECREALEGGRYEEAKGALDDASDCETQFGDAPTYRRAQDAMESLVVFGVYYEEGDDSAEAFCGEFETLADARAYAETSPAYLYRSEYDTARKAGSLGPHALTAPNYAGCGEPVVYCDNYSVVVCPVFADCDDF